MTSQIQNPSSEVGGKDENELDEELEKLEADVNQMAQKILEYRTTLPDQLKSVLASTLAAQRPLVPTTHLSDGSEPLSSGNPNPDSGTTESGEGPPVAGDDQETAEKTQLLKRKISSNTSAMPVLLKRMKECISRIDSLESSNGFIHPVFRRKRTS